MGTNHRLEEGMAVRSAVLGADHVARSMQQTTEFMRPLQELITEYCWGTIWARPGIDRKTRSMLNLAMLSALRQKDELKLHVRGALANGCTVEEIQEVLLQVAVYCGVPAALDAFRIAEAVVGSVTPDGVVE